MRAGQRSLGSIAARTLTIMELPPLDISLMTAAVGIGAAFAVARSRATHTAPVAERVSHFIAFGDDGVRKDGLPVKGGDASKLISPPIERSDDLFWLRSDDRSDKSVIALVEAENAFALRRTHHTKPLQ